MDSPSARTKNLSVSVPKDVHSIIEGIVSSFSPTLDLSKRGLEHLSEEIFKISHLKQLHLQRNELSIIPKDFFQLLPNLVWLDLRHNKIKAIPSGIGSHKNLKTLLMEKNPIKALPVELGNLMSLKALNLRSCPLEFPPPQVIHKGLPAILAFLRTWALEHSASLQQQEAVPMQRANSLKELSRAEAGEDPQGKDYRFPTMEKLNLAEVAESSPDLSEDWSSEEGMKQFWKLRQEIVANEKAEILSNQLLPTQLPLELQSRAKAHLHKPKYSFRKKTPSFKSMFPEIPSYETQIQIKKDEEKHLAALKELKEKQALIEQRKSSRASAITLPTSLHRVAPRSDVPAISPRPPLCLFEALLAPWDLASLSGGALHLAFMTGRRREAPAPSVCRLRQPLSPSRARRASSGPSTLWSGGLGP
ncbi:leucine-rich repeat-containing protein 27 isoform X6 [Sminthopsis crassicaudata]|uniref:leucine-rich repeat-containing protein 27 isoform X6 n=1 Tax=Sminthopsis crassicaudata TaxID=9301 RepID=UPI003D697228